MTTSRKFTITETSKGNDCFGPSELHWTEIVHTDGRVESKCTGFNDFGTVKQNIVRYEGRDLDLDVVTAARIAAGWKVAS